MRKILIGSTAIKWFYQDFSREPNDLDYAVDLDNIKRKVVDNKVIEYLYNPILFKYTNDEILNPSMILTLKMSHISWDVNFKKHMFDIQFLLKKGVEYNQELYNELFEYWTKVKTRNGKNKRSDLTLTSKEFFDNAIPFDHDFLHTMLKEVPTYTKILKDNSEVEPCEQKFLQLTFNEAISVIQEEVMVMAYERFRHLQYKVAFNEMLQKYITHHAPIWQLIFIIKNFNQIREIYNYYNIIENNLKQLKK